MTRGNRIWYLAVLALVAAGCGAETTLGPEGEEIGVVRLAVDDPDNAPLLSSEVFVEPAPEVSPQILTGIATEVLPAPTTGIANESLPHWYRLVRERDRDVTVHIENHRADVEITHRLQGVLRLDIDGDGSFGEKEFRVIARRRATFEREAPRHWRLTELSPVAFSLADPDRQTVRIERVAVSVGDQVRWEVSDPATRFAFPSGLPIFAPGEQVVVTARIANAGMDGLPRPSRVYLHYDHRRVKMSDDGHTGGDAAAGDGVFTHTVEIGDTPGFHHAAIDALDAEVFADELTQNYNAAGLGMPVLVAPSFTGTMHRLEIEGGCWQFVTDDGHKFEPVGGPADLYQDGQRAVITGVVRSDILSICQVGSILRVITARLLP